MLPKTRLYLCGFLLVISALYASLIAVNTAVATAVALGYVAVVVTIMLALNVWRRP